MADPSVCTIVHAYEHEARFCLQRTGSKPGNIFDVQLAAAFNGHNYPIAYDRLVNSELRRNVGPSQSRTNWMQRPLTDAQTRYAAEDVHWLFALHDRFLNRMSNNATSDRLTWLQEETESRLDRINRRGLDRWRRLPNVNKLPPRSLAVARALATWRETEANNSNIPLRRVASDELLVAIAATRPTTISELSSVRGSAQLNHTDFSNILDIVESALELPESKLPTRRITHGRAKPSRMVVLFLESVLAAACAPHRIDPELVGGSSQVRSLVNWNQKGRPIKDRPAIITGWRGKVCAKPLLDALDGNISLRLNNPLSANPLTVSGLPTAS